MKYRYRNPYYRDRFSGKHKRIDGPVVVHIVNNETGKTFCKTEKGGWGKNLREMFETDNIK